MQQEERKKHQAIEQVRMECLIYVKYLHTSTYEKKRKHKKKTFYFHKAVGCGAYIAG
jgi:hypothetical protein